MNLFILAAGLGTRLKPLTDTMPKALVPVGGRALLQLLIEKIQHECDDPEIVINIHHFADQIIDFVEAHHSFDLPIRFSDERDQLLETGGGLKQAAPLFNNKPTIASEDADVFSQADIKAVFPVSVATAFTSTLPVVNILCTAAIPPFLHKSIKVEESAA